MFLILSTFLCVSILHVNSELCAFALSSSKNSVEGELKNQIFCSSGHFSLCTLLLLPQLSKPWEISPAWGVGGRGRSALWAAGHPLCSPVFPGLFFLAGRSLSFQRALERFPSALGPGS